MANKITNTLIANITAQEDSTQNIVVNRSNGNPSFDSTSAQLTEYFVLPMGDAAITLPLSIVYQLYIKNIDAGAVLTPKITPKGGAQVTTVQLYPGDQFIIWQANTGANAGITALVINSNTAGALVEFFMGG